MPDIPLYTLRRSRRQSVSLEITRDLTVLVRAPQWLPKREIDAIVLARTAWIDQHREAQRRRVAADAVTDAREAELRRRAAEMLPARVTYFSRRMGLYPTGVRITAAKTRFGSCSAQNRLCFSWRLMAYPPDAVDYVVVHELAHIRYKNHGAAFYALIETVLPDYRERIRLLRQPADPIDENTGEEPTP